MFDRTEKAKIATEQQMISKFTRRTRGDLQIALKFVVATFATALCEIGCYRSAASPCLTCQTIELFSRESTRHFLKIQS
jgi:hypothetical protein